VSALPQQQTLNRVGALVAIALLILQGFALYALVFLGIPEGNNNALMFVLGSLSGNVTAVVSFFFGSSSSGKAKDDALAAQAVTIATATPPAATVPLHTGETATAVGP
jgi:hypothetical protein